MLRRDRSDLTEELLNRCDYMGTVQSQKFHQISSIRKFTMECYALDTMESLIPLIFLYHFITCRARPHYTFIDPQVLITFLFQLHQA